MKFFRNKKASGSIETAIGVITSVILGSVALVGLTSIIDTTVYKNIKNSFDKKAISVVETEEYKELDVNKIAIGDCNMDGTVDAYDVEYLERGLAGWDGYVLHNSICDVFPNGVIDEQDVAKLKEIVYSVKGRSMVKASPTMAGKQLNASRTFMPVIRGAQKGSQEPVCAEDIQIGGNLYGKK